MGGTDDPENIILVTPEEHANEHRILYEKYGKIEDYLAWKGLSGLIGKEEIIMTLMQENGKKAGKNAVDKKLGIFNPEVQKSEKYKEGMKEGGRISGKKMSESGHCKKVGPLGGGKNLGKSSWLNPKTGKETQSFESPGEDWILGVNMERVNIDFLRKNANNVKGSFWIFNKETGKTRMIFESDEIPPGFSIGRIYTTENTLEILNTSTEHPIEGIPQIEIEYDYIIYNPGSMRWEFIPKKTGKRLIKVSHTDYYGLVWARDCFIDLFGIKKEKSKFNFSHSSVGDVLSTLKDWRKYVLSKRILDNKKMKKNRKEKYQNKMESLKENFDFLEGIRNTIMEG
jgi:hypothetical protein